MTLLTLNFKNYYDRKGYTYSTIDEYIENAEVVDYIYNYDFNPNDGVWSSVLLNTASDKADYLLVFDETEIVSRWYILDSTRMRAEQYSVKLLRDVIADYYDIAISVPTFIEKATVKYGNPLLFNPEEMTFNQIKTKETLIRDMSLCPWIVGYIKSDTEATTVNVASRESYYAEYNALTDIPYYDAVSSGKFYSNPDDLSIRVYYLWDDNGDFSEVDRITFDAAGNYKLFPFEGSRNSFRGIERADFVSDSEEVVGNIVGKALATEYASDSDTFNNIVNSEFDFATATATQSFLSTYPVEGVTIKVGDNYYNISRNSGSVSRVYKNPTSGDSDLQKAFVALVEDANVADYIDIKDSEFTGNFQISGIVTEYDITIKEVQVNNAYTVTIPGPSNRTHLLDAPYDMFAIPYPTDFALNAVSALPDYDITGINADAGMQIATSLSLALGDKLIDLQLLPYCPIPDLIKTSIGYLYYPSYQFTADVDYNFINYSYEGSTYPVSMMFWAKRSDFSTQISRVITKRGSGFKSDPIAIEVVEPKIEAMCDFYRLCSPNYNGQFEFNAVKNEGVDYFNVNCTYKPYSPYIRVAPNFKGLYGGEYGDARGLICGGDFGLATLSDAWTQYQINNKNYLNAFDRQIENMEFQHKYQKMADTLGAVTGTAQGAVSGGMLGGLGGGGGAVAGAIIGGGFSAAGGYADVSINNKLRNEAIDYSKDNFGYQLGNIRALPYTLNRVSSFNINNKLFPVLEYYTCTETEKQALRDKIKYNGMSVGVVGTIAEYVQEEESYIKGRVIRVNDLSEDYHIASALAEEIYKGVFI